MAATVAVAAAGISLAGVAIADNANATTWRTSGDLFQTPWFEAGLAPWAGPNVTREIAPTPNGHYAARITESGGRAVIDDWPGEVKTVKGGHYMASGLFRAARFLSWNRPVYLVIRERNSLGQWVGAQTATRHLRYSYWDRLTVNLTAAHNGDTIDVYAYQTQLVPEAAFWFDAASLYATTPVVTPPPPPPPPGDAPSTLGLLAYATGQPTDLGNTSRYKYVVVQENQFAHIAEIKRMNPNTKVLAYMQAGNTHYYSSCGDTTSPHLYGDAYGVSYCWANRFHPDWFLTDRAGHRLQTVDYSFLMPMDVGNPVFAATWAQGTYANLKQDGFDGVWMDDVNIDPGHGLNGRIAKYSDEQYGAATTRFTTIVGDYMRAHGMLDIANVGMEPWVSYQLSDVLALGKHLTAVNREHYVRYGDICGPFGERFNNTATNGTPPLSSFFNETRLLQAQGTKITGVDYGYSSSTSDDTATMTYGRALFLLSWDGSSGSAYFFRKCGVNDTSASQWTASIGLPAGPVQTDGNGILTRKFQHGVVVLNPNRGRSAARVSVPAGLHTLSGTTADGGVYVAPQTAAILSS